MAVSPLASIIKNTFFQTCTVYRYGGADPTGQPKYNAGELIPCRLAIRTKRVPTAEGDYITNTDVSVLVPAETALQAYDMIDLPAPYEQGAIIGSVTTGTDQWGNVTHQVVRIQ